ncbi:methyltransferase [Actinoplanes sp. DH11]|uniref:methyltransferase n=1 Tax=Actinoplanes sp. DH11 TaxID=2857011 RepID=UPI001E583A44|nr:methyltransferase [Actinoplanes sp. DH11]
MFNDLSYELSRRELTRFREGPPRETFTAFDREWALLPEVWPGSAPATKLFTAWLPYAEAASFLEVGCGAGVTAVIAVQSGCSRVCALDINPAAVATTNLNAARHGVDKQVTVLVSDLFDALAETDRFDIIFWNSPFVEAPADFRYESGIEYAGLDAGYAMHQRFFAEAGRHLTAGGRVFLGFSDTLGNPARLREVAALGGFTGSPYRREVLHLTVEEAVGEMNIDYVLYEFRRL